MNHFVRMFSPRFAPLVESGAKLQTIRPTPKRMPQPGDTISLRCWTGKPYRSKQRVLREAVIAEVAEIELISNDVRWIINAEFEFGWDGPGHDDMMDHFARDDGFKHWPDMRDWFQQQHGLPFSGILIRWK